MNIHELKMTLINNVEVSRKISNDLSTLADNFHATGNKSMAKKLNLISRDLGDAHGVAMGALTSFDRIIKEDR